MVRKLIILLMLIPTLATASDSLRTVSEFAHHVMGNLNLADTLNGNDRIDSIDVQRLVRSAVGEVANLVGLEKAKSIVTTAGTWGYEVEKDIDTVLYISVKRNKFAKPIVLYSFPKLIEAYNQSGYETDTASYFGAGLHGDSIYPYPIPNRVDTLFITYRGSGKKMTAYSDTVNLNFKYYPAIEYLATSKAAAILNNYEKAKYWFDMYGGAKIE